MDEFFSDSNTKQLIPVYLESSMKCLDNCSSPAILSFIAELLSTLLHKGVDNRLASVGFTKSDLANWLENGISRIETGGRLKKDQMDIVVRSLVHSESVE